MFTNDFEARIASMSTTDLMIASQFLAGYHIILDQTGVALHGDNRYYEDDLSRIEKWLSLIEKLLAERHAE